MAGLAMTLVVYRHSPAVERGVCYGHHDVEVRDAAGVAASHIMDSIDGTVFDCVWSSTSLRCSQPARIVADRLGLELIETEVLREMHFGEWEGRTWSEIERTDLARLKAWGEDWVNARVPGGESALDLEMRVRSWLGLLDQTTNLVVTHAGVIRSLRVILEHVSWPTAMEPPVPHLLPIRFD